MDTIIKMNPKSSSVLTAARLYLSRKNLHKASIKAVFLQGMTQQYPYILFYLETSNNDHKLTRKTAKQNRKIYKNKG